MYSTIHQECSAADGIILRTKSFWDSTTSDVDYEYSIDESNKSSLSDLMDALKLRISSDEKCVLPLQTRARLRKEEEDEDIRRLCDLTSDAREMPSDKDLPPDLTSCFSADEIEEKPERQAPSSPVSITQLKQSGREHSAFQRNPRVLMMSP